MRKLLNLLKKSALGVEPQFRQGIKNYHVVFYATNFLTVLQLIC